MKVVFHGKYLDKLKGWKKEGFKISVYILLEAQVGLYENLKLIFFKTLELKIIFLSMPGLVDK